MCTVKVSLRTETRFDKPAKRRFFSSASPATVSGISSSVTTGFPFASWVMSRQRVPCRSVARRVSTRSRRTVGESTAVDGRSPAQSEAVQERRIVDRPRAEDVVADASGRETPPPTVIGALGSEKAGPLW